MSKPTVFAVLVSIVCMAAGLSGCATITRGTTEPYTVTSEPPGALVQFSTGETCITPCTIEKKRNAPFQLTVVKPGYLPTDVEVESESCSEGNVAMAGNLVLVGTLVWAGIDAASGATKELSPNPCRITLERRHRRTDG